MARWLTPARAILIAILGGLILGLALRGDVRNPRSAPLAIAETRGRTLLERRMYAAHYDWREAAVVDSLQRRGAPTTDPVTFLTGAGVPSARAVALRRDAERAWRQPASGPLQTSVVVAAVLDTAGAYGWYRGQILHVLPANPATPCLTVIQLGPAVLDEDFRYANLASNGDLPGLCGLVAQVGVPGMGVRDWLVTTSGTFARLVAPTTTAGLMTGLRMADLHWELQSHTGRLAAACIAGRTAACEAWITEPTGATSGTPQAPQLVMRYSIGYGARWWASAWASALLEDQGMERFRQFWSSEAPFGEAFRDAFGTTVGTWTSDWIRGQGIDVPRELRSPWRDAPVTLLVTILFAGVALAYSTRRTVSA